MKLNTRILDATASNRSMWKIKDDKNIVYIDVESELELLPDFIMDCTKTNFKDKQFHTIFFDPPHKWGEEAGKTIYSCRNKAEKTALLKKYGYEDRGGISYYGIDKFKTKTALLGFLNKAQLEFQRILFDDGILWLRWSEWSIPLDNILILFDKWKVMLKITEQANSKFKRSTGKSRKHWVMLMKKCRCSNKSGSK